MNAHQKLAPEQQMTVREFLAFTASRPNGERWELIEGVAVLNAAPVQLHQMIVANIVAFLVAQKQATGASWYPMIGVGTVVPVSPQSLPQPDVYVQAGIPIDSPVTEDAVVIFEVLSRSNKKADQEWRKRVYSSVPNCQHYLTVSRKLPEVTVHSRDAAWKGVRFMGLQASAQLPALGVSMPLSEIYRWTPLAKSLPVGPKNRR